MTFNLSNPNDRVQVGKYLILQNEWNSADAGATFAQTITGNEQLPIGMTTSWDWPHGGGHVKSYPCVIDGHNAWGINTEDINIPVNLSSMGHIVASYDVLVTATGQYNISFDLYTATTNPPTPATLTKEIMIWVGYQTPWLDTVNGNVGQFTIDGKLWNITQEPGTPPLLIFNLITPSSAGTINIDTMLNWAIDKNYLNPDDYLTEVDFGNEIVSGSGTNQINNYSIEVQPMDILTQLQSLLAGIQAQLTTLQTASATAATQITTAQTAKSDADAKTATYQALQTKCQDMISLMKG